MTDTTKTTLENINALYADLDQEEDEYRRVVWPTGGMMTVDEMLAKSNYFRRRHDELSRAREALMLLDRLGVLP